MEDPRGRRSASQEVVATGDRAQGQIAATQINKLPQPVRVGHASAPPTKIPQQTDGEGGVPVLLDSDHSGERAPIHAA